MTSSLDWRLSWCFVGCVCLGITLGAAQSTSTLGSLTVPAGSLPTGCGLRPSAPEPTPIAPVSIVDSSGVKVAVFDSNRNPSRFPAPFPSNPWVGTDYKFRLALRKSIDSTGAVRLPDAPPLSRGELTALESKWADDVVEAYRATYQTADGGQVQVSAVRFNDSRWATVDSPSRALAKSAGASIRVVRDATVILISGASRGDCFESINRHIAALK
jgi:hypothetical protein